MKTLSGSVAVCFCFTLFVLQAQVGGAEPQDELPAVPNGTVTESSTGTVNTHHPSLLKTFTAEGKVWAVAFSPDGKMLASGTGGTVGTPGGLQLWDVESGQELLYLSKPRSVRWVDFAPNGDKLVAALHDNTAKVFDVPSGEILQTLRGHTSGLDTATYSPDGKLITTSSWDRTARIWNAETDQELQVLKGHEKEVFSIAFSPNSRQVITASGDQTAKVWDVESGKELLTLRGHEALVHRGVFSPDGQQIATASWDKTVRVWNAETGDPVATLAGHTVQALSVAYSPDGKWLASVSGRWGDYDYRPGPGELKLWDATTFEEVASIKGHTDRIFAVVFSPDSQQIATGSWDKTVKLWDVTRLATPHDTEFNASRAATASHLEYKALVRDEIERLGSPDRSPERESSIPNRTKALTAGLNILAQDGWRLVAIEHYHEYRDKTMNGNLKTWQATLPATYIFVRER